MKIEVKETRNNNNVQAVLFARVSSREQERGESIDAQLKSVRDYCVRNHFPIIKEYALVESSTQGERKKFYEMIEFVKKQSGTIIIVANTIDRIQRRFKEYIEMDVLRQNNKIEIHFLRENLKIANNSNSYEIGAWTQGVLWAQQYVLQSSDNIKRALEECWNKGRWLHQAPLGYRNYRDETGLACVGIDPIEGPLVQKLFETYATGNYSLQAMADFAQQIGLKNKSGRRLHKNQVHHIFHNPFYYGVMRIRKSYYTHIAGNLISKELFDTVQKILSGNYHPALTKQRDNFIFSGGIIRCASCGCAMTSERHIKKSGKEYVYLKCSHYHRNCQQKNVSEPILLEQLEEDVLNKLKFKDSMLKTIQKSVRKALEDEKQQEILLKAQTQKRLDEIGFKKKRCLDLLIDGTLTKEEYKQTTAELVQEEASLKETLKSQSHFETEIDDIVKCVFDFASNVGKYFKSSNIPEKQQILRILVSNCALDGKKLRFSLHKPFNEMLENPNCLSWWAR